MQDRYRERSIVRVSITNEAVDDPSITENDEVVAVIKASDVMVGK
jgi:molybdopterin-binding protein